MSLFITITNRCGPEMLHGPVTFSLGYLQHVMNMPDGAFVSVEGIRHGASDYSYFVDAADRERILAAIKPETIP